MSDRKTPKFAAGGGGQGSSTEAATALITLAAGGLAPRAKQHTVRVRSYDDGGVWWFWERQSGNRTPVAGSYAHYADKRHCVRAARAEARLTGARLVIDGQEVGV